MFLMLMTMSHRAGRRLGIGTPRLASHCGYCSFTALPCPLRPKTATPSNLRDHLDDGFHGPGIVLALQVVHPIVYCVSSVYPPLIAPALALDCRCTVRMEGGYLPVDATRDGLPGPWTSSILVFCCGWCSIIWVARVVHEVRCRVIHWALLCASWLPLILHDLATSRLPYEPRDCVSTFVPAVCLDCLSCSMM